MPVSPAQRDRTGRHPVSRLRIGRGAPLAVRLAKALGLPFARRRRSLGDSNRKHMGTAALDVDSGERAPPSEHGVLDLAQYTLEQVRRDTELVLFRGLRKVREEGSRPSILVRAPLADHPSPATLRKMQHEYALRSELDPAHVVRPLALVQAERRPILILQDPGGTPLDLLLNGAMEIAEFLALAVSIAAALGHVHGRGLVHKDINPANILVSAARDQAWLMGLGVASRLPRERQSGQLSEFLVGTLAYMAPEQTGRMNRSIDSRSDLYGLGVTFYEMLTGTLPFTVTDPMELVHCHIARQPTPLCEKVNSVPRAVSAIIMKLLAKTAEERYQTAAGLESDLRRCLAEWEMQHRIDEFPLGEHDTPDRLLIPEQLYGRAREIKILLGAFERVVAGDGPRLVLVSGYSGIGKSAVVNELHKPLVPPRGLFASGKFDQYKRDIPYATLAQAFQGLIRPLLSKSEEELSKWRNALLEALDPNGQLMMGLVPDLKTVLGEQPPVPDLPPQDARRRFQLTFRRFVSVFARPEHPLALFLDDLQWIDAATLDLLEDLLTGPDLQHLLLVGAYRANELTSAHSLRQKLEAIEAAGGKVVEITLAPLAPEHLQQLIAEALRCEAERAAPLAQLVHEKTGGNPFFANRFIASLAEEGMLTFDHDAARWSWDLGRIHAKGYTDNLVDLMVGKLTRLTAETQKAVQELACLGNAAAVATLSLVYGTSETEIHSLLDEAVRADLLERRKDSYHFIHDRIQEAAYLLVPESLRPEAHLRIGRLLAANAPPQQREGAVYEIVNQLNRGASLITSGPEREQLAELNLIAGKRAKASTAYGSALNYLVMGEALLPEDCWERRYPLVFAIEVARAECEFLTGDLAAAEERLATLSLRAANLVDKAAVACLRAALYTTLARADRAVEICVEYLREAGIACSPHPTDEEVREEYERLWTQLGSRPIEALFDLPLMGDPDWRATMEVLTELSAPAFFIDANLQCLALLRMANLSAEHGNCEGSCYAYGYMNTVVGARFGNYRAGLRFGELSLDLVEKKGLERFKARVCHACGHVVIPWEQNIRAGIPLLRRSLETALETGDQTYAAYAYYDLVSNRLTSADPLAEVQREAESALEFVQQARFGLAIDIVTAQLGFIRTLRGLTREFGSFSEYGFDEGRFEQHLEASPSLIACWYWVRKLQARFYAGDCAQAVAAAAKARSLLKAASGWVEEVDYHFYAALARATASDSATPDERREHSGALAEHHQRLALWAENCPENFANRAALVAAEIARVEGRDLEAECLYEQAIRAAHEQGFVQNEGLAYELAARFYAARGFEAFADLYLRRARHCYQRWGADGKVRQLVELYPRLRESEPALDSRGTSDAPVEQLDLATVLKVSQAVSGEMILDRLLDRLMRAAIEHAGAERGLLIARRGDELQIQAQATASGADVTVNLRLRDSDHTEAALPQSLVRYVMRTQETVILEDASSQNLFSADPYLVQRRARSVLCLPLIDQGNLIGVLYLENNLAPRVFAPARIAVLRLLASQAATSLERAAAVNELHLRVNMLQQIPVAAWSVTPDGTPDIVNQLWFEYTGQTPEYVNSHPEAWMSSVHPEDRERASRIYWEGIRSGRGFTMEARFLRASDGIYRWHLNRAVAVRDPEGNILRFVGTSTDVHDLREVQEELRNTQAEFARITRVVTMGELTASIAHEVNQPLGAMVTSAAACARWLAAKPPQMDKARRALERIANDGRRAGAIIERIRALLRRQAARKDWLDVNETILDVIALTQYELHRNDIVLETRLSEGLPRVPGDKVQCQQVLLNLIINAIEAMSEIGQRRRELTIVSATDGPDAVRVEVRDTGPGLDPERAAQLFEPFYTTKAGGLGIGLSVSRSIVEAHGGRLTAGANAPHGAVFCIRVPVQERMH